MPSTDRLAVGVAACLLVMGGGVTSAGTSSPTVSSVTPSQAYNAAATAVTITGEGFEPGATVAFGLVPLGSVTRQNSTTLTAMVPADLLAGAYDVTVTNLDAGVGTLPGGFTVLGSRSGAIGAWQDTVTSWGTSLLLENGRIYEVDDCCVQRADLQNDGSLSAWTNLGEGPRPANDCFFSNADYIWGLGTDFAPTVVGRAAINADGSLGAWQVEPQNTLVGVAHAPAVVIGSAVYIVVGATVYRVPIGTGGSLLWENLSTYGGAPCGSASESATAAGPYLFCLGTGLNRATVVPDGSLGSWVSVTAPPSDGTMVESGGFLYVNGGTSIHYAQVFADGSVSAWQSTATPRSAANPHAMVASDTHVYLLRAGAMARFRGIRATSVSPTTGRTAGGTAITIAGFDFQTGATVKLGGVAATNVVVTNAQQITAQVPAHAAGAVDVEVTNPDGSPTVLAAAFTYYALSATAIAPTTGTTAGGTTVTLTGVGFQTGATVKLGGVAATNVVVTNAQQITAQVPAHAAGVVDVEVMNPDGSPTVLAGAFTYYAFSVTAIAPTTGTTAGGTTVTLTGVGFQTGATVKLGGVAATNVVVTNAQQITAQVPAHAAGVVDVEVTNPDGSPTVLAGAFTYYALGVTAIAPTTGTTAGGTTVTLTGVGFQTGATVKLGGVTATNVVVTNAQQITALTPAHAPGAVDVEVTNPDRSLTVLAAAFTYYALSATAISPTTGTTAGGTTVTLTGVGFQTGATVKLGGVAATNVVVTNAQQITAQITAHAAGVVDVEVTNPDGSPTVLAGAFTYYALSVSTISPTTGTTAGGTTVTLTGVGFQTGATVKLGGVAATNVVVTNAQQITAQAPAHAAEAVDVEVTNPDGSPTVLAGAFTYYALSVTAISPTTSTTAGCTSVTISGSGFQTGATVKLGGVAATSVVVRNGQEIAALTPAHAAGAVDVEVTNADGSRTVLTGGFTYTNTSTLGVSPSELRFGAVFSGTTFTRQSPPQDVTVTQVTGCGTATWTVGAGQAWIALSHVGGNQPWTGQGSGHGQFRVSVAPTTDLPQRGSVNGAITITDGLTQTTVSVPVTLDLSAPGASDPPFGYLDTPADNATGLVGAVSVSGWALDDVGIDKVRVYRDPVPGIHGPAAIGSNGKVYIGDGTFVAGARPDVETAFPGYPLAYRAGWGYLMLSNMLPHQGNGTAVGGQGTFTLYAYATDLEGNTVLLGSHTITLDNDHAQKPFGTIDTPAEGATIGGVYTNFGWALTPNSPAGRMIPTDGSTMWVFIDGVPVGHPVYNQCRAPYVSGRCSDDIATLFPNRLNVENGNGAIGYYTFDTRTLSNGLHTIAWSVTDSLGGAEGIGSRFFTVFNGAGDSSTAERLIDLPAQAVADAGQVTWRSMSDAVVWGRAGFDLRAQWEVIEPDTVRTRHVRIPEMGRVELYLGAGVTKGYLLANGTLRSLPPGSQIKDGLFTWVPAVGYLGGHELVFLDEVQQIPVTVTIHAASERSRVEAYIDEPRANATVRGPFTVAGWAADPTAWHRTGIGAVHVWAHRRDVTGVAPTFLGAAELNGYRPDVGAALGAQFERAGWGLTAPALPPGEYDVVAYFWSARTGRFEDARVVRVSAR